MQGKRIGGDPETDVALVKVPAEDLTAISFGDSDKLEIGDFVIAIGNPFQIGQTVTSGIVSGLRRSGLGIEQYEDFIQTDASINPGNSGGALVNLRGELVGINTAIVGPAGGNVGIGFAIPANLARAVVDQLVKYGDVRRGRLGIAIQDLTRDLARKMDLSPQLSGAVIAKVEPGSPAERAGLKVDDVVTALGRTAVRNAADLRNKIGLMRVGDEAEFTVLRNKQSLTIQATVGERETEARPR
jgi:serine protease Do/serine protease DegQ